MVGDAFAPWAHRGAASLGWEKICKSFAGRRVLDGIDLRVEPGSIHFILGRSGAGKSVLIKHVVGLIRADAGKIYVNGVNVAEFDEAQMRPVRATCQLIFQHSTLFDQLSVLENICMPLQQRPGIDAAQAQQRAEAALAQVQATHLRQRRVAQLGAGVQKRIAIARAVALRPTLLLYDEPTTGLDPVAARRTDRLMRTLRAEAKVTQVVVSHDLDSTATVADVVSFLHAGQIYFHGSAKKFLAATDDPVIGPFLDRSGGAQAPTRRP